MSYRTNARSISTYASQRQRTRTKCSLILATLKGEDCELALLHEFPAFQTDPESPLVKVATAYLRQDPVAVPYATEAAVYAKVNPNIRSAGLGRGTWLTQPTSRGNGPAGASGQTVCALGQIPGLGIEAGHRSGERDSVTNMLQLAHPTHNAFDP